jgi:enoyl-CoA hydratase/carnithine racemase
MSPGARIKHVQSKMGVTTGWGGGRRLAEIVGRRNALRMLTFGETVDVDMAVRWGLCDYVTPEDETAATFIENLIREEFPRTASPVTRSWKAVVDAKSEREEIDLFTTQYVQLLTH